VVLATLPLDCVRVRLLAYPLPRLVETSKPDGAVTVRVAFRVDPETVKEVGDELAVP
jgi:hypothetical protein